MSQPPSSHRPGPSFWVPWALVLAGATLGLGWFSYTGIAAVRAAQTHFQADAPAVRAELPAGTSTFFYEYEGPPPSYRYHRPLPELACTVTVVQTGVAVPARPSPRQAAYKLGTTTGVSLQEVDIRAPAPHDVRCTLAAPFPEAGPVHLVLGQNVMTGVLGALAGPMLVFLAVVGALVAVLWKRLQRA